MGATVDALHRLQEIELQIAEVRQRIDRKHRAVKKHEKGISNLDATIRSEEASLLADQMEADRVELEMKTQEAAVGRLRQALNLARTNKEYSAILTQLNTNKADISKLEERVLAVLNQIDLKKKHVAAVREEHSGGLAKLDELKAATREIEESSRHRLARFSEERERAAAAVPPTALQIFNRIAGKQDGEAMALVLRTHPKREEYACDGCNMSITLEQVNAILSRDEAVLCNTCGRILYLESSVASSSR